MYESRAFLALWICVAVSGCPAAPPSEAPPKGAAETDTDTDTDTDADADTDTDTDADTDTGAPASTSSTEVGICFASYEKDTSTDGTIEEFGIDIYDPSNIRLLLSSLLDYDNDGYIDWSFFFSYDASGNMLERRSDTDGDGVANLIDAYTYDISGNVLMESTDEGNDGTIDTLILYTYDANGSLQTYQRDNGGDGTFDYTTSFTYDSAGREATTETDADGDSDIDSTTEIVYDDSVTLNGTTLFDTDLDGDPDVLRRREYDAAGNLTYDGYDFEADGVFDSESDYAYDPVSGLLATEETVIDILHDQVTHTWDALGREILRVSVLSIGGSVTSTDTSSWTFGGICP